LSIDELSDGTKTQLLLAARLALIELLMGEKPCFLMLDEPFAYFDNDRKEQAMEILKGLTEEGWQIIIVSARKVVPEA